MHKQNKYLVRTGVSGPDMPYDLHLYIWGLVFENERARLYGERQLRFRFFGFTALAPEMLQGLNDWVQTRQEQILQRLGTQISSVFHEVFQPDTEDLVNLTGHAWTEIVFQITSLRREHNGTQVVMTGNTDATIEASSPDGLHRIDLRFTGRLPEGPGPYTSVSMQYVGPQRVMTFNNISFREARGGYLDELGTDWLRIRPTSGVVLGHPKTGVRDIRVIFYKFTKVQRNL